MEKVLCKEELEQVGQSLEKQGEEGLSAHCVQLQSSLPQAVREM